MSVTPRILYCRAPGLLARAATRCRRLSNDWPLVVVEGRAVLDACKLASGEYGVSAGTSLRAAKWRCPVLLAVPAEEIDARPETEALLRTLADRLPYSAIEPDGPDGAFVALALPAGPAAVRDVAAVCAMGPSRNAARALAECGNLYADRLPDCDARWIWPEDPAVAARLFRLGLSTFGDVAAHAESALIYQFGAKIGRQLFLRARGRDLTPVRALYPPPTPEASRNLSLAPVCDAARLGFQLARLAAAVARELRSADRVVRRLVLDVQVEGGRAYVAESALLSPAQDAAAVGAAAARLLTTLVLDAPVTGLRLRAAETEPALAVTGDLLNLRQAAQAASLRATRHALASRFGPRAVLTGAEREQALSPTPRERRRRALAEGGAS